MDFIKEFGRIGKDDAASAGGKGASLGEMTQAGIPVPPGFVILSSAFERFLDETNLNTEIDTILHSVDQREMGTVENASARIQALILNAKMPEDIAATVQDFYTKLDAQFVAVRSSATAEDSASAAWAGQLDSFLNTTEETLLANVQKCWASLFTPRAIFYRYEKELHKTKISVAVVVQKMVQSEVSGIAFSVHPVTEDYNQLIIEAGFGLGEAIVSGSVTPDSYVVEKEPRRIIDKNITYQSRALWRAANGGNEWRELSEVEGTKPALSDEQALALAEIILRIESHYGFPCDIEWAFEAGQFFITQSRPITTLAPLKDASEREYYRNIQYTIMGRYASYPADTETWHTEWTSDYFEEFLGIWKEMLAVCIFDKEFYMYIATPRSFQENLLARVRELTAEDPKAIEKIFLKFYGEKDAAKREIPTINPSDLSSATNDELVAAYKRNRDITHRIVVWDQFTWLAEEYWQPLMDKILINKLGLQKGSSEYNETLFTLIKPREISTTLEEKREVIEETLAIQQGRRTTEAAAEKLARDFGWMPVLAYGTPWGAEHYREELAEIITRDKNSLQRELSELQNYTSLRDKDLQSVVKKYSLSPYDLQIFIDFGLAIDTRNEAEYIVCRTGIHLLELYTEMCKRFGISVNELRTMFEADIISSLRGETNAKKLLKEKGRVVAWGLDGATKKRINFSPEEGEKVLAHLLSHNTGSSGDSGSEAKQGVTASRGKVRGIVRLVPSPEYNHKVEQGDILFAYATMTDNLPAMKKAVAIVTEVGGLTCHAAVVSREFNIPCIVGLKNAMTDFHDGDLVEVDADNGVVRILERTGESAKKDKLEFTSPELAHFPYRDFSFLGLWKSDLFAGYFWAHWFNRDILKKLDFSTPFSGCVSLKGGHFFYHKKIIEWGLEEVHKMIADTKGTLIQKFKESAENDFAKLLAEADSFADREPTAENFKRVTEIGLGFMTYWVLSNLLSPEFDSLIAEKAVAEGIPAEDVVGLIPKFPALIDAQHADAKRLLTLLEKRSLGALLDGDTKKLETAIVADKELKKEFDAHLKEFGWIELLNYIGTPLSLERLLDQLKTAAKSSQHEHHQNVKKLSKEFQHILNIAADVGFVRQGGAESSSIFHFKMIDFLEKTAKALGLEYREMLNLVPEEIIAGLEGTMSRAGLQALVQKRLNYNWIVYSDIGTEDLVVVDEKQDVDTLHKLMVPTADENADTLIGQIGNKGKVQGRASVILASDDFPKFVEGSVLVTTMTTPDFVILMQKSVAIVTDIGGMLSHASIVSRELHKPCVIGTKFATQVLHDGDLVEVDADNGVVRILERGDGRVKKNQNESTVSLIKKTDWHSDWSGPFSLFGLSLPTNTYFDGMEKYFGKGLSQVFVAFKNGVAFSRLPGGEYHDLGVHLAKKAEDSDFVKEWASQFKRLADKIIKEIPATAEEFVKKLPDLLPHYQAYGAHNAATKIAFDVGYDTLSKKHKELLEEARKYSETFYKDDADIIEKALRFLAQKTGYAYEEIYMLTYDELRSYLDTGILPPQDTLKKRWVASGVHFTRDKTTLLSSEELEQIEKSRLTGQKEIAGQTAYRGKVRGRCHIVLDYQNARLEEGEILVTGMTDPNFVELMKKASAIVTDGGGMLSHAAIVARELKKPCVIGTKIATQVLKDGDLVEVDADNGVVRKIF